MRADIPNTTDALGAQPWPRRSIAWLGALLITGIVALAGHDILRGYQSAVADTQRELQALAHVLAAGARGAQPEAPGAHLERLRQTFAKLRLEAGTTIALRDAGGALLAQWPAAPATRGERFVAEAPLAASALSVVVTRDRGPALAEWRAQAARTVLTTLGLALLASALLALVTRQFRRLAKAHRSLAASRERFALAAAGSDDGIWDWELATDRIHLSLRARELYGVASDLQWMSREQWFATFEVHPEDAPRRLAAIEAHMTGATPAYVCEYRVRDRGGPWRWLRARGLCVRDANGAATRMAGSVSDIDARQRAEEALRESEKRFALAVAGSDDGVWEWDFVAQRAFESARARELQGLPPEPQSQPLPELLAALRVHPDDAERRSEALRAHLAGEVPAYECEYRVRHADGACRWVRVRALCIRDAEGRPLLLAGSVSDIDARCRTEQSLRQSEERYALAMTGSRGGHWVWEVASDALFVSRPLNELYGLPADTEAASRTDYQARLALHPDDRARIERMESEMLTGGRSRIDFEFRIVVPGSSEVRWIMTRAQCFRDAQGRAVRVAGVSVDATERKRMEEALRASEERFTLAVAGSKDGIVDWDIVNDRMFNSERALRILGIGPGSSVASCGDWMALVQVHPEDAGRKQEDFRRLLDGDAEIQVGEYRFRQADGSYRWARIRGIVVRDAAGRAVRWAGSVADIDVHKQTEAALRRSEERYQLAVAGANQGLWDWDLESDTLFLSARAQAFMGLEPGEPLRPRREWIALSPFHPEDRPVVRAVTSAHLRGESSRYHVEYRLRHTSGQWRWHRQSGVALRDATGRPFRMAGSMEDVTDRKEAEAERARLQSQLLQAKKLEAIGTLAGGIAHDFNNILAAILGYGEMAQKDAPEGGAQRQHLDAALAAALRAKSLVERILAFSRSGMGDRVPVHVQSVVAEALDAVAASLPAGVHLERALRCGDAAVLGDATQVHQVVMNLCANAVQAMRSQGTLTVTLDLDSAGCGHCATSVLSNEGTRYLRLGVSDTGSGIAPELLERIFDPFFTTKDVGVGTGLGLSLVHGIVTDLGGGIEVQSRLGEGSTFSVYLPWRDGEGAAEPQAQSAPHQGAGETILLVDDEEALVRLGEEMIAQFGYEPVGFTSGPAALAAFRAEPRRFDAVLTDEAMPGLTGSELARQIRALRADIPIVLMTGYVSPALQARAQEAGVQAVLAKPLAALEIARGLAAALRRPQAEAAAPGDAPAHDGAPAQAAAEMAVLDTP